MAKKIFYKYYLRAKKVRAAHNELAMVGMYANNLTDQSRQFYVSFFNYNDSNALFFFQKAFFEGLGFVGMARDFPFGFQSCMAQPTCKFTEVDLFLLYLLYQPAFTSAMSIEEAKRVFDKIKDRNKDSHE